MAKYLSKRASLVAICAMLFCSGTIDRALAQPRRDIAPILLDQPSAETQSKIDALIDDISVANIALRLDPRQSKLVRTKRPVDRFSVTDPGIVEIVQFGPTEFELIGDEEGQTSLTLWFRNDQGDMEVLRYLVRVTQPAAEEPDYGDLEDKLNELFPNSAVQLLPIADKLIVRGQARDEEEALQIMAVIRGQQTDQFGALVGPEPFWTRAPPRRPFREPRTSRPNK